MAEGPAFQINATVHDHIRFKKAVPLGTVLECDERCLRNLATVLSDGPNSLSKIALEIIFLLSKLAYKSYFEWYEAKEGSYREMNPKIVYTNKYLAQCNITNSESDACGLLKATNTLFATGNTVVYSFNHLSVQEYFCALYISLLPEDQQLQLLKDHISDFPHMWPFYAGITKLRSCDVIDYLYQFLVQDEKLENADFNDYNRFHVHPDYVNVVLNCIYEAQLSSCVCHKHEKAFLVMPMNIRPYDCLSIAYFMSIAPVVYLSLRFCKIGDQEAEMFTKYKVLTSSLQMLNLCYCNITHKGMENLIAIIKSSASLTHFLIADSPIGDDGVQLVIPSLKYIHLIQLNISRIGMTEVGTCVLVEYLKVNSSLQSLEISHNRIEDSGLTEILNNLPGTLVRLIVSYCRLTYNGAVSIGKVLSINKVLKYLNISSNSIGDDGISAISHGLCINTTLIQLIARGCRFHSKGAESIAKMLQANKALKYLDISSNEVGDDGIKAITHGIQANTTLIQLKVFYCGGAEGIANMLIINKTLKELGITYSNDGDTVLETYCKSNCELRQLNIAFHVEDDPFDMNDAVHKIDGTFSMIIDYINEVNLDTIHATSTARYITYDNLRYSELEERCILKKHDQAVIHDYNVTDDIYKCGDDYYTVADFVDNTEEWFISNDISVGDRMPSITLQLRKLHRMYEQRRLKLKHS